MDKAEIDWHLAVCSKALLSGEYSLSFLTSLVVKAIGSYLCILTLTAMQPGLLIVVCVVLGLELGSPAADPGVHLHRL